MAREAIEDALRFEHPLRRYTSFRVGGCAEVFAEPTDMGQLQEVLRYGNEQGLDVSVLGKGCNVLISDDGVRGMVVHLTGWYFNRIERRGDGMIVCGGGANLSRLVADTAQWGLEGLETLVGVPGSLGGAVAMNAGGRHGAIGSYVRGVTSIGYDGEIHHYGREEIEFGYRCSSLSSEIIMDAELELVTGDKDAISTRMSDIFHQKNRTQPLTSRSAGCVFKNPEGHSAGALIDTLGLKSMRIGDAAVSGKHANFIINLGSATASQIMELICKIRDEVKRRYGQILDMEIKIW
jgi:UDP-N-acetylmuramate dehydrogenase